MVLSVENLAFYLADVEKREISCFGLIPYRTRNHPRLVSLFALTVLQLGTEEMGEEKVEESKELMR